MSRAPKRLIVVASMPCLGSAPAVAACGDGTGPCCKTCRAGKACGDTYLAQDDQCTVGPGCACDG